MPLVRLSQERAYECFSSPSCGGPTPSIAEIRASSLRRFVISTHLLGTNEFAIIEHTGCGMLTFEDEPVRRRIAEEQGAAVDLPLLAFGDLEANLRAQLERIRRHPWVKDVPIHGLVYEVESGRLRRVD